MMLNKIKLIKRKYNKMRLIIQKINNKINFNDKFKKIFKKKKINNNKIKIVKKLTTKKIKNKLTHKLKN